LDEYLIRIEIPIFEFFQCEFVNDIFTWSVAAIVGVIAVALFVAIPRPNSTWQFDTDVN